MTDKSKNERRPARRPGGDAARPSKGSFSKGSFSKGSASKDATDKGAPKFAGPGKFSGRSFAGGRDGAGKDAGENPGGRRFGDGKSAGTGGKSFGGKSFGDKSYGKPFSGKSYAGKPSGERPSGERSFGDKSYADRGAHGKPRTDRVTGDRPSGTGAAGGRVAGGRTAGAPRSLGDRPFGKQAFGDRPSGARFGGPRLGGRAERGERHARSFGSERTAHGADRRQDETPAAVTRPDAPERIAKTMSRAGVASRRDAEVMIAEGRVAVNGKVIDTPVTLITSRDRVEIDGAPMPRRDRTRLWLYHKPRGLVTTARDPEGRPTVFDALPEELPRVVAIGRLDINTEGLLLLTNDGGLSRVLEHPETGWLRRYRVRAYGDIDQAQLDALRDGITIDDMHYGPVEAAIQRRQGDNVWLMLGLREGKNREVKRILEHLGLRVNRLIRVSFGPFQLGDLPEGELDEVRTRILKDQLGDKLASEAGADFDAGSFEPSTQRLTADRQPAAERPAGREGRYRSKEDFLARAPRAQQAAPAPHKREAFEVRSRERAVWRDDETEGGRPKGTRVPRRGADPRSAREQSAERVHERVGAITDPDGRKVKVERIVATPRLEERPARKFGADRPAGGRFGDGERPERRGFADRGARPERTDRPEGRSRFADRGERPARPFGADRPAGGRFGDGERPERRGFADRGERPAERPPARDGFASRGERSFGDRPAGKEGFSRGGAGKRPFEKRDGDRPTGKSFGGKSFGGKSFAGKPSSGKPFSGKPRTDRPSSDRPRGGSRPPRKG